MLDAYLRSGGSLVFLLGEDVNAENYNRELGGQTAGGVRLLPAQLGEIVKNSVPLGRLNPLDYRHPIVQPFQDQEAAGLLNTPIFKYFKLTRPKDGKATTVLAIGADNDPLIVEESIHRGRVVLVATSADDAAAWSGMGAWPTWLPLVQEMLAFAVGAQAGQRNRLVGEPLEGWVAASAGDSPLAVQSAAGRSEAVRLETDGDYSTWRYAETGTSGIYTAKFGPPLARSDLYAVNVDPKESDLATLSQGELKSEVWPGIDFNHQTTWQNLEQSPSGPISQRSELPKQLLYVVLGMLLLETCLARWFGHHGDAGVKKAGPRAPARLGGVPSLGEAEGRPAISRATFGASFAEYMP